MRRDDEAMPIAPANDRPSARYRCGVVCGQATSGVDCPLGPTAAGTCRNEKRPCVPTVSVAQRGRIARRVVAAACLLVIIIGTYYGRDFYKPGALSTPHAQILAGQLASQSCAACHPGAASSPIAWFLSGHNGDATVQTDRCMDCHHGQLSKQFARSAHNLSPESLASRQSKETTVRAVSWNQWLPRPSFDNADVACAVCHREHGGANVDLTHITNSQCQTCHTERFDSFATDHPDWQDWPYKENDPIAFDHRSHVTKHFPAELDEIGKATPFDCIACHAKTDSGQFARVGSYETMCAQCHDKALRQRTSERIDLFVVPALTNPNLKIVGNWPASATGFNDGKVPPLARVLMSPKDKLQGSIDALPASFDYSRIDPTNDVQQNAAQDVAAAIRGLIEDAAKRGPMRVLQDDDPSHSAMREILKGLSPQLVSDAAQRWFAPAASTPGRRLGLKEESSRFKLAAMRADGDIDALLGGDLLEDDPLLEDAAEHQPDREPIGTSRRSSKSSTFDPLEMQPAGGWYVDDTRLAISYRGDGHADPVIRAAIELAVGLPKDNTIRRDLLGSGPALACIDCHRVADGYSVVQWKSPNARPKSSDSFTKFSHAPHMNLPTLTDCGYCHQVGGEGSQDVDEFANTRSMSDVAFTPHHDRDFHPLTKQACANCHTANAAGDSCTKCHYYHSDITLPPSDLDPVLAVP